MNADEAIGLFVFACLFVPSVFIVLLWWIDGAFTIKQVMRCFYIVSLLGSAVSISDAQGQAQAQTSLSNPETTQRIVRLEDQSRSLEGLTREMAQVVQQNQNLLAQQAQQLGKQDERLQKLENGLTTITATAEGATATFKFWGALFAGCVSFFMLLTAIASIGATIWQARRQAQKIMNGEGFAMVKKQIESLQKQVESQPTRRTR